MCKKTLKFFDSPDREDRVFFVGDVHGCFEELKLLLKKAGWWPKKHRLVLLGDLINKGPCSFEVLQWLKKQTGNVQPLLGNHEEKFIQTLKGAEKLSPRLEELKTKMGKDLNQWVGWIQSWPVYVEESCFVALHGGLVPGHTLPESPREWLLNIRHWDGRGKNLNCPEDPPWHALYKGDKLVVYAHWAGQGLCVKNNSVGLDTGCVYGGKLTGMWLPSRRLVQVSSLQKKTNFYK